MVTAGTLPQLQSPTVQRVTENLRMQMGRAWAEGSPGLGPFLVTVS